MTPIIHLSSHTKCCFFYLGKTRPNLYYGRKQSLELNGRTYWHHMAAQIWINIVSGNDLFCRAAPNHHLNQFQLIIKVVSGIPNGTI